MLPAATPHDEQERLDALRSYQMLDSEADSEFDAIVRRAAGIFDAPIAALTLVDKDRQWFKSKLGLAVCETPRAVSFCAHVILDDQCMAVEDAYLDPRFADNPLVTGLPSIRFYVGAPLITRSGFHLGALCAIKPQPHSATRVECKQLAALAGLAVARMEMSRTMQRLAARSPG